MSIWTKRGKDIFDPVDAAGSPRKVVNGEVQTWSTEVETAIVSAINSGAHAYATKADLDADLDHPAGTGAWVVADDDALNGIYTKTGASGSGSWQKIANLPTGPQGDVGGVAYRFDAGTADADPGTGLIRANDADLSAATELYVSKANRYGDDLSAFLATLAGSTSTHKGYLILTAPDSETQAAFNVTGVTDATGYVKLSVSGQGGATAFTDAERLIFLFSRTGNAGDLNGVNPGVTGLEVLEAETVENVRAIIQLPPKVNTISPMQFGAKDAVSNPGFNSSPAFSACLQEALDTGAKIIMDAPFDLYGGHIIPYGTQIEWLTGAWTRQRKRSVTGAFLRNGGYSTLENRKDITILNPHIDGSGYPIFEGTVVSADATTVTIDASAPTIDDYFNGDVIQITTGSASGLASWATVTDYDGASRTVVANFTSGVPAPGDQIRIGYNDPAFVLFWGPRNTKIIGGRIKNFRWERDVAYGYGSKAINLEQGHSRCLIDGVSIENCGTGIFLWARPGTVPPSSDPEEPSREDRQIVMSNIICDNVGSALTAIGTTTSPGPDGDPEQMTAIAQNWSVRNSGHNPNRLFGSGDTKMKAGVINLGGAQNLSVRNWKIQNQSTYPDTSPGYPSEPNAAAYGLSGPIGAVVWGWGRNINVEGVEYHGDCDQLIRIERPKALNVDAGNTNILHSERFDVDMKHYGTAGYAAEVDPDDSFQISRTHLTGTWKFTTDVLSNGVIGPNLGGNDFNGLHYDFLNIEIRKHNDQALITGTPERHYTVGANNPNTGRTTDVWHKGRSVQWDRARLPWLNGQTVSTPDDALSIIPLKARSGFVIISSETNGLRMMFDFRTHDPNGIPSAQVGTGPLIPDATTVGTGSLVAGGGPDVSFNIGIGSDGNMYVSNRRGSTVVWNYTVIGHE